MEAITSTFEEGEFDGLIFDTTHPFINHGSGAGFISGDQTHPDEGLSSERWTGDDFVQLAKGRIRITEAGEYTFGIHSDDGFGFRIFGTVFTSITGNGIIDVGSPNSVVHPSDTGDSNTRAVTTPQAGDYGIEFFWWECGGGDYGELYAAKGSFALDADMDTWKLVDEEGGLPFVAATASAPIRISNVNKIAAPASVEVTFTFNTGQTYQAQYSLDLKAPWTNMGGTLTPTAGATTATATIPLGEAPLSTATQAHFRIRSTRCPAPARAG